MLTAFKNHSVVVNLQRQYELLTARDRLALNVLALALMIVLLIYTLWLPARSYMIAAQNKVEQNEKLLAQIKQNRVLLASLAGNSATSARSAALDSQQLVSSVTNMAKQHALLLKRFEPSGENKIKIWIENESFDKMISWLNALNTSLGIKVEQISVEKADQPGLVSARITLAS